MRGGGGHVYSKSKGVGWTRVCNSVLSTEIRGHVYRCLYDKDELNKTHPGIHTEDNRAGFARCDQNMYNLLSHRIQTVV